MKKVFLTLIISAIGFLFYEESKQPLPLVSDKKDTTPKRHIKKITIVHPKKWQVFDSAYFNAQWDSIEKLRQVRDSLNTLKANKYGN